MADVYNISQEPRLEGAWFGVHRIFHLKPALITSHNGVRLVLLIREKCSKLLTDVDNVCPEPPLKGAWFAVHRISRIKLALTTPHKGVRSASLARYTEQPFWPMLTSKSRTTTRGGVVCGSSVFAHQTCVDHTS